MFDQETSGMMDRSRDDSSVPSRQADTRSVPHCPCFTPGTLIKTNRGEIAVETLAPGDLVLTRDNGFREVKWIGLRNMARSVLQEFPQLRPIRIKAGALGPNLPETDTFVSPQHRILLCNNEIRRWFGTNEVLVAAHLLICFPGIDWVTEANITYIHFMFDQHEIVLSNGIWSESYQPQDMSANGMDAAHRAELLQIFPELENMDPAEFIPTARKSVEAGILPEGLLGHE